MATKSSNETVLKVDVEPFKLALPQELMVTPKFSVEVSNKVTAKVFAYWDNTEGSDKYDVKMVSTKTGKSTNGYYSGRSTFRHLFDVMQFIIDVSTQLNVKKRTRRTIEVDENTDDED